MKIAIDPAHGGIFHGAVGLGQSTLYEKDITLSIGSELAELLKEAGHTPILTRTSDIHLDENIQKDLMKRAEIAQRNKAECLISIHCNAYSNAHPEGIETWYQPESEKAAKLAESIQAALIKKHSDHVNKGVRPKKTLLFSYAEMPACHIETEFITNAEQHEIFLSEFNHRKIAKAITDGVLQVIPSKKTRKK